MGRHIHAGTAGWLFARMAFGVGMLTTSKNSRGSTYWAGHYIFALWFLLSSYGRPRAGHYIFILWFLLLLTIYLSFFLA